MKKVIFTITGKVILSTWTPVLGSNAIVLHCFYGGNQILVARSHVSVKGPNFFFNF